MTLAAEAAQAPDNNTVLVLAALLGIVERHALCHGPP